MRLSHQSSSKSPHKLCAVLATIASLNRDMFVVMADEADDLTATEDQQLQPAQQEDEKFLVPSKPGQPQTQDNVADSVLDSLIADTADQSQQSVGEVGTDVADSTLDDVLADVAAQAHTEQQLEEVEPADSNQGRLVPVMQACLLC